MLKALIPILLLTAVNIRAADTVWVSEANPTATWDSTSPANPPSAWEKIPARLTYSKWDVSGGFGVVHPLEDDIFNLGGKDSTGVIPAFNFGINYSTHARISLGAELHGYTSILEGNVIDPAGNTFKLQHRLNTYNLGLKWKYFFTRNRFEPYIGGVVGFAFGYVENDTLKVLNNRYGGFSMAVEPGIMFRLGRHFGIAVEGILTFGAADWDERPFNNSQGTGFSPGYSGIVGKFVYRWVSVRIPKPV